MSSFVRDYGAELCNILWPKADPKEVPFSRVVAEVRFYVQAVKDMRAQLDALQSGKCEHKWRECFDAGVQSTRCSRCGVAISVLGERWMRANPEGE